MQNMNSTQYAKYGTQYAKLFAFINSKIHLRTIIQNLYAYYAKYGKQYAQYAQYGTPDYNNVTIYAKHGHPTLLI